MQILIYAVCSGPDNLLSDQLPGVSGAVKGTGRTLALRRLRGTNGRDCVFSHLGGSVKGDKPGSC